MALRRCCAALALAGAWCPPTRHIQRAVAPLRAESDGEETTKSIDEVLADAEGYDGMPIVDPYYMHPDTLPLLHEWSAETFDADLEAGGHAEWDIPTTAYVFLRHFSDDDRTKTLRKLRHLDHLFWVREADALAERTGRGARVHASQLIRDADDREFVASLVSVVAADEAAARELVARDPLGPLFEKTDAYHWTIADDPYLQTDVWPVGAAPYAFLRLDDATGTANRAATRDMHLSFLRKTERCIRAGPLRPLDGAGSPEDRAPVGSLVYAFHDDRDSALAWAARDPYVEAGVFGANDAYLCATYNELEVTGRQVTLPTDMRGMADPLLSRLVGAGLVDLPERVVERIEPDPETGKLTHYNITTTDPRIESNVRIDSELMARMQSTPKAVRAGRKRAKQKKEEEEEDLEFEDSSETAF